MRVAAGGALPASAVRTTVPGVPASCLYACICSDDVTVEPASFHVIFSASRPSLAGQ